MKLMTDRSSTRRWKRLRLHAADGKAPHHAKNKHVVIGVLLEVVDLCLTHIAHIAQAQSCAAKDDVESEELTQRRSATDGCGHHVVVVVAAGENLIIRLPVVGREHHARERHRHLIDSLARRAANSEAPRRRCRRREVYRQTRLCGVVAVARVVKEADVKVGKSTRLELQTVVEERPMAVHAITEAEESGHVVGVVGAVAAKRQFAVVDQLLRPLPSLLSSFRLRLIGNRRATIFLWREIGVEDVG